MPWLRENKVMFAMQRSVHSRERNFFNIEQTEDALSLFDAEYFLLNDVFKMPLPGDIMNVFKCHFTFYLSITVEARFTSGNLLLMKRS